MFLLYSVTTAGLRTVTRHLSFDDHLMQLSWCTTPWTLEATRSALLSCHFVPATSDGFLTIISDVSLPWCHPTPLTCTGALSLFPGDLLFQHIQYVDRDEVPVKVQVCVPLGRDYADRLHRLRQPCCALFKIGLNFQRASFFFSSSETSRWNFDGLPHIEESALTH